VGLYGILASTVSCRVREIGVRMALGAHPKKTLHMVVRQGGSLGSTFPLLSNQEGKGYPSSCRIKRGEDPPTHFRSQFRKGRVRFPDSAP